VRVNCAAIPRDLVESEMFGHEKGSFTGATERRIGRFELAHTGTLFLDEVGDLGAEAQAKLLRAIEAKEIERVGGAKSIRVDVRIVAATNRDLTRAVTEGVFREDLLFRLNVIPIEVPPLRERPDDIPSLVAHFSALHRNRTGRRAPQLTAGAMSLLARHRWPGNVRELANIVERLAILHAAATSTSRTCARCSRWMRACDAPSRCPIRRRWTARSATHWTTTSARSSCARLSAAGGNVADASRRLKTDRANLYRRMRRLGIPVGDE
jgi:two-component system nitrogen regulation response regulator NtrX